jgi:lysophospholipase L1-like esterase
MSRVGFALALILSVQASFAAPIRILPLGDSITDGYSVRGGYRAPLFELLTNAGYSVEFLGTQTNNGTATMGDAHHEGHSGYRIDEIAAGVPGWLGAVDDPDIILLLVGANDYSQHHDTAHAPQRLDRLIEQIADLRPAARLVVANLPPRDDNRALDEAVRREFNPFVSGIAGKHAAAGQRVWFVDMRSALDVVDLSDGLHPNQTGYDKMATNWFAVISRIVACSRSGETTIDFDGVSLDGSLNHVPIPGTYQPIPGLTIGYSKVGVFNQGPDHTTGIAGGSHYSTFCFDVAKPQVFTFSRPVSVPSVFLATYAGGTDGSSAEVRVTAYADADGIQPITNRICVAPAHPFGGHYRWVRFDGLKEVGPKIMRLEIFSDGNAQVDDLTIGISTNLGPLKALRLRIPASELHEIGSVQVKVSADDEYSGSVDVTSAPGLALSSSDTNILRITGAGRLTGVHAGRAIITAALKGISAGLPIDVMPGALMDFNAGLEGVENRTLVPADYQPVPGVKIGYGNVGLFNGGPDHTLGVLGANRFNTYQFRDGQPQVFTFSRPVSIPSLWVATFTGNGDPVTLNAYADEKGERKLGTAFADTKTSPGAGGYAWAQCTRLADSAYAGKIRRLEIATASGVNANADDLSVVVSTNLGALQAVDLELPAGLMYQGMRAQAKVLADYENCRESAVTTGFGVAYASSAEKVAAVDANGFVRAIGIGKATVTATLGALSSSQEVAVLPGHLVDFNLPEGSIGNFVAIPSDYQPVPGLIIGYENVGLFNGGPDHTTGEPGGNRYNTYQFQAEKPQAFTFNYPVGIPTLSLATYEGSGSPVTISAYGDTCGTDLIGSVFFVPARSAGAGDYVWTQCTNFDSAGFNGQIRRLEISGPDNANLDDLVVGVGGNLGNLRDLTLSLPLQELVPGMSRPAAVLAHYDCVQDCDVSRMSDTLYRSSDNKVVTVDGSGLVQAVGPGSAEITASFHGMERHLKVLVRPLEGTLVSFDQLAGFGNKVPIPSCYQPVPGLTVKYDNVGIYNEGPDHTAGVAGGSNYNSYQYHDGAPQVFAFSKPVSLPSFWLSTYWGSGDQITISAYSDEEGKSLIGTQFVSSPTFAGPGNYRWVECTNLNTTAYNGRIRRIELLGNTGNAQLDDMLVR